MFRNNNNFTLIKDFIANHPQINELILRRKEENKSNKFKRYDIKKDVCMPIEWKFSLPDFITSSNDEDIRSVATSEDRSNHLGIETILPGICFPFLNQNCVENHCLKSHKLSQCAEVNAILHEIGPEKSSSLFRVIVVRCEMVLNHYFETFIRYFSANGMINDLISMIEFSENPTFKLIDKLEKLLKGFMSMGRIYSDAVSLIIQNQKYRTIDTFSILFDQSKFPQATVEEMTKILSSINKSSAFVFDKATVHFFLRLSCELKTREIVINMCQILEKVRDNNQIIGQLDENIFIRFMNIQKQFA